jgi:hypothetical protein
MTVSADGQDFATMIGGASGALTGSLSLAVSLNANRIAGLAGFPPPEGRLPTRAGTRPRRRRDSLADRQADGGQ